MVVDFQGIYRKNLLFPHRCNIMIAEKQEAEFMWNCPKCGRSFQNQNQSHYCGTAPKTVEEYIAAQAEEVKPYLEAVRSTLRASLPEAQERISWSMPTFWQGHNIIHFAAHKNHIGLYAGVEAVVAFREELAPYKTSKGTIQLPYREPLPLELIARIAAWCLATGNHP